jgi:hypothetical protein
VLWREPEVHVAHLVERLHEQPGCREQHERHRNLGDHEDAPARVAPRRTAGRSQHLGASVGRRPQRRCKAEEHRCADRCQGGRSKRPSVERRSREERHAGRHELLEERQRPPRQDEAEHQPHGGQGHALGQELSDNPCP